MRRLPLFVLLPLALALDRCASVRPFSEVHEEVGHDRFLPIGGRLVHVEQAGTGAPVVLLHGFGGSTYSWRRVMPGLAASFHVVAIDLNGFGYTERPRDLESYTKEAQGKLVLDVMDALGIEDRPRPDGGAARGVAARRGAFPAGQFWELRLLQRCEVRLPLELSVECKRRRRS